MKLSDYLEVSLLETEIKNGYVSERPHPDDPFLVIYNYTKKAQAEGRWNDVTRKCRGLIVRWSSFDGVVVARPFEKFFNYGEHPEGTFDLDAEVVAFDKLDGSLGILYPRPKGGWAIATRGSFESEQAVRGTEILQRYIEQFTPRGGHTYLFEIIYSENRIVVDYGDAEKLVLLDMYPTDPSEGFNALAHAEAFFSFPMPDVRIGTLREILALPPRPNAEGWVVVFGDGTRVKVKQEDYIRLHRIVTGLNELTVWEARGDVEDLIASLPEEFRDWVDEVDERFLKEIAGIAAVAEDDFHFIMEELPWDLGEREHRKRFAQQAAKSEFTSLLFLMYDEKWEQLDEALWRMVRPTNSKVQPVRRDAELPIHRTEAGYPRCATCEGGGCPDCTDPA